MTHPPKMQRDLHHDDPVVGSGHQPFHRGADVLAPAFRKLSKNDTPWLMKSPASDGHSGMKMAASADRTPGSAPVALEPAHEEAVDQQEMPGHEAEEVADEKRHCQDAPPSLPTMAILSAV